MNVRFLKSATNLEQCPPATLPEFAVIGRSNAGKSSLLNAIVGQGISKTSKSPGKTTLINFFEVDGKFRIVDLPGYGYASRSHKERESWAPMIENYLKERESLRAVILVIDGARKWSQDENDLLDWFDETGKVVFVAVNKMDRFNQKETSAIQRHYSQIIGVEGIFYISAKTKKNVEQLFRSVFEKLMSS
jgi:GTP-binding protein